MSAKGEKYDADGLSTSIDWDLRIAEMRANMPRLKEAMEATAESYGLYAKQYKLYFDHLVAEGFLPQQAIEIVKTQGWVPK